MLLEAGRDTLLGSPLPFLEVGGMMRVRVKLFATLTRYLPGTLPGTPFEAELADGGTVLDLIEQLSLPKEEVRIVFVNGRSQPTSYALSAGDEVGIFPPVGGG